MYLLSYPPPSLLLAELFVTIPSWLGQGWDPAATASLPLITHSTCSQRVQGPRPGCQCCRALNEMTYVIVTF